MFRNVYYNKKTSKIHLWETINGKRTYDEFKWVPYVYVKTNSNTGIKSIYGDNVQKREFDSWFKYRNFCQNASKGTIFENEVKPEIQFLAERYYSIDDEHLEIPDLKEGIFDIEVYSLDGSFPSADEGKHPVSSISIYDTLNKTCNTFSCKEYTGSYKVKYHHCENEFDLLYKFFNYMHSASFDVISGWNIFGFDLPYLYNRCNNILGENSSPFSKISPINKSSVWEKRNGEGYIFDFAGVSILDYMDVYKQNTPRNMPTFKLDYVSKIELEEGKIDYSEYENLNELYEKNFNKFIEYNIMDVYRIAQLEEKLGYISLIQSLSLLTKCPMKFYDKVTSLIEGAFLTYYRRNNLCAPCFIGGDKEDYDAAYVKEPTPGFYHWTVDLDVTSSYPTAMVTLNMSNETYKGKIKGFTEDKIVEYTRKREFPEFTLGPKGKSISGQALEKFNIALKRGLYSIAPNGVIFTTNTPGVVANVEKDYFNRRNDYKQKKKKLDKLASKEKNKEKKKELEIQKNKFDRLQLSLKRIINSIYGAISVPYTRYYNLHIAEAITACGRHVIKEAEKYANEIMNEPNDELKTCLSKIGKLKDIKSSQVIDFNVYTDTDSIFPNIFKLLEIHLEDLNHWNTLSLKDKEAYIIELSKIIEKYVNTCAFERLQLQDYNSQVYDFKTTLKQELVSPSSIFVKKKKYAMWITNKEGAEKDELLVKGLELIQSSTPETFKEYLKQIMEDILKGEDPEKIREEIFTIKKGIYDLHPEEIAVNIGVSKLHKYLRKDGPIKGTPFNARSVYNYRQLLYKLNLKNKYEDITQGEKVKIVYVKKNKFNIESIAFKRWPQEFYENGLEVDYDKMFDKHFIKKLEMLLKPANMLDVTNKQKEALEAFF